MIAYKSLTIGCATIYLADCREILFALPKVDAVITDPPYGIGFAARPTKWQRRAGAIAQKWDDATFPYIDDLLSLGDVQCVWGGNHYPLPPSRGWLCWLKPDALPSMSHFELCWTNQNRCTRHIKHSISATNKERVGHPTQKPLAVMRFTLEQFPKIKSVLDPFMGSGTTGVAYIEKGIRFFGVEIDPVYFEQAAERLIAANSAVLS